MSDKKFEMTFDPNVINHLGIQMYSTLPPVIGELIANAYDAEAENVNILLNDTNEKEIRIIDDGHGMSYDEVIEKFLKIGRNRRELEQSEKSINGERYVIGKKGIGKLSFFGIAQNILINTVQNNRITSFELNWDDLKEQGKQTGRYEPKLINQEEKCEKKHGTEIILSKISRKSKFDSDSLAFSLARSFQIFNESNFCTRIFHDDEEIDVSPIKNELRYKDIDEFLSWSFPLPIDKIQSEYLFKKILTEK